MGSGENKATGNPASADDQLAKDVARLYSWANVEGVPYRDFSRQRKMPDGPAIPASDDQRVEVAPSASRVAESEVAAFAPVTVELPAVPAQPVVSQPEIPPATPPVPAATAAPDVATEPGTQEPFTSARVRSRSRFVEQTTAQVPDGERPVLAVHSLAGGVGKTTLCANLARILCSLGEQVLLVDASGSGLLPFYFGANDLRPGLRKFIAPGMTCAPLQVIGAEEITEEWLSGDVKAAMVGSDRVIFDLGPASFGLLPNILGMASTILVPLLPDLNSIL